MATSATCGTVPHGDTGKRGASGGHRSAWRHGHRSAWRHRELCSERDDWRAAPPPPLASVVKRVPRLVGYALRLVDVLDPSPSVEGRIAVDVAIGQAEQVRSSLVRRLCCNAGPVDDKSERNESAARRSYQRP